MKKISLYFSLALMAILGVSCNDDYKDWLDPQSYLPEDAITISGFSASPVDAIDLGAVESDSVQTYTLNSTTLPENFELNNARIYLFPANVDLSDMDGIKPQIIPTDINGFASVAQLQEYIENTFGVRPDSHSLIAHVYVNAIKDGQAVLIDAGEIPLNITPAAPVIENTYYLVGYEDWSDNNTNYALTNGGGDPYENPVFSVTIPATGGDIYFKVAPQSAIGDADFWNLIICAVTEEDDDAMEGKFAVGNNGKAFKIPYNPDYAEYKISFNMLDGTYVITGLTGEADVWYMVGNCIGNGSWGNSADGIGKGLIPLYPSQDDPTILTYTGMFPAGGQFKMIHTPGSWDEQLNYTNISNPNSAIVSDEDGDNHNIGIVSAGLHTITVNTATQAITVTPVSGSATLYSTITMPGTYQGWNVTGNAMTAMSTVVENHDWVAKVTFDKDADVTTNPSDPEGFKFANGTWDVNWGGSGFPYGYGAQGGPNIPYRAGTYTVCFNDITGAYLLIK